MSPFTTRPTPRVLRQFAGTWLVFFLLLAANQIWRRGNIFAGCVLGTVALIGIVGLIKPNALRWLFIVASAVAFPIGWVVNLLMLAIMFYGVITPVALFWRLRGRDVLRLRDRKNESSFWTHRDAEPAAERYLKQF
jgi:hypothetical protein